MNRNASPNGEDERRMLRLEEELRQSELSVDISKLDQIYADDVMVTTPGGVVVDKSVVMAEFHQIADKAAVGQAKIESYNKDEIKARTYGDTAVTSYLATVKGQFEGTDVNRQFQITNVWMKRQDRWQIVARHTASIESPKTEQAAA